MTLLGEEHVRRYLETGGTAGHTWNGVTCLVLWTVGRRTGQRRVTPLIYGRDGDHYLVIASQGGAPAHPGWYHNIVAEPRVEAQVLADRFQARARTAEGEERERLWKIMAELWPNYDEYARRTSRHIPVVVLERT
ncbi:nitroreductase [Pseudofrankia asymbiotica]|uniref:Nitroreductase n=1 Tax=Pseudofrankia asymbiotica TaxID=1834516 RepID=A0A1V2I3Y4_9ACTN|nr:nitroreductase family deazaflavin-dependent oxidoreductase [Pseudofrankia asymbiotica]ONH25122.1 nitroreductase [Pseudofrankia asymbiotica]